ncbi:MAG: ROK family protein [Acutalibacteraceae bacterium]|nr:ROK family protein [Acutalibacteraceae bacterium]
MKGNTQLRQESLKRVLTEIRAKGPISKRQLQKITDFSWGNMSSIITVLCESGYIVSVGKQNTGVGRKPEEYDINSDNNYIIGIDFNSTGTLALVCDLRGRIVKEFRERFEDNNVNKLKTREEAEALLYKAVSEAVEFCSGKNVAYIAVAMQGDVDTENGISANLCVIKDWKNVPVCQMLEEKFGIKTVMLHDPDCVIYAERFYGALADSDVNNAVEIRIEHGLGMAAIINGQIYMGNKGKTCEIKNLIVPSNNELGYSYVENVIGNSGNIVSRYTKKTGKELTVAAIGELARSGNEIALEIFKNVSISLAFAISNICAVYNPDKVVLFGEMNQFEDIFLECLKGLVKELNFADSSMPEIELSKLDYTAAAVGAALFVADKVVDSLYFKR